MGFFGLEPKSSKAPTYGMSRDLLHRRQCEVCPLNRVSGLAHPKMKPAGSKSPLIYMLGEAPGEAEDEEGRPFVGEAAQTLRLRIPKALLRSLRWNNCVRTRPPDRPPTDVEIECCRPSIVKDIEESQPRAIFGFGNIPLNWVTGDNLQVTKWSGRKMPVKIGNHVCWYFPIFDPEYVMKSRRFVPRSAKEHGSDFEFAFALHLDQAFSVVEELPEPVVHPREDAERGIEIVDGSGGKADFDRVLDYLDDLMDYKGLVGFDYENSGLRPFVKGAKILTLALSKSENDTLAFALDHPGAEWTERQRDIIDQKLEDFLYESKCRKIVHNLAYEQEWSAYFYGRKCLRAGKWGDTMVQAYILDERQGVLSLEALCLQYFGLNLKKISNLDRAKLAQYPVRDVLKYNALDAKYHRLLYIEQDLRLLDEGLERVYDAHLRRVPTMVLTQIKGVPINQEVVQELTEKYTTKLAEIEEELFALKEVKRFASRMGHKFNISSTKDVIAIFKQAGHKLDNVDEDALKKINHPLVDLILEWRRWNKLLSTYVKPVTEGSQFVYPDGKVHPVITTTKTVTSRTASEAPNQQNWPKREDKEVRRQVKGKGSFKIVSFDYGQIQARNVAMESKDKALIKAFWDRYDIHEDFMQRIFKYYPKWIEGGAKELQDPLRVKYYRNRSKNEMVFPSFFGAQPKAISGYLGVPLKVATKLHEDFAGMFPDIPGWHDRIKKFYKTYGYVTGLSGYRRRAPISPNELINAPIQADEALIVCDAMARLSEMEIPRYQATMEIHDDLTFVWPAKDIEKNAEVVIKAMLEVPFEWAHIVPIVVEMEIGDDWGSMKKVNDYSSDVWSGHDPFTGTWAEGTGWSNANYYEKTEPRRRKKAEQDRLER